MTDKRFERTVSLIGEEKFNRLKLANVAVFGIGGVGAYAAEALVRAGVGAITVIDGDIVDITNINRQIVALTSTVGLPKCDVLAARLKDINPEAQVLSLKIFYCGDNANAVDFTSFDYVADAIDTVSSKLLIIKKCKENGIPVISAMGAGNKLIASGFKVADIKNTKVCPLARVMRRELKKLGITSVKTVYSEEEPVISGMRIPSSISYAPAVCGLLMAGEIIRDLAGVE